ncbi:MAG: alpha/beta hydrolase [Chloroflexi bacterium]|nr:alpha/beta hydrolase [Chloroflexota bacterium]
MSTPAPTERFIQVNGLRLHYVEWGEGNRRPVLLLHGIAAHARYWDPLAKSLCREYRVIALDLRGHGDSQWSPQQAYQTEDYVADVAGVSEALRLDGAVVVGGSLGGRVAMVYGGVYPERVSRLVVEDVGPVRPPHIAERFQTNVRAGRNEFHSLDEVVTLARASNPVASHEALHRMALHGTRPLPDGNLGWKRDPALVAGFVPVDLWGYVRRIQCPTLIVLGSESTIVSPEVAQQMLHAIPDSRLVVIPGAGHNLMLDKPAQFEAALREFLAASPLS